MPRASLSRRLSVLIVPVLAALVIAAPVAAGKPAAQQLNPMPPDVYTCTVTGGGTICRATTSNSYELEPTGIWCGSGADAFEVLDSGGHEVRATRFYDTDGNLVRRELVHRFPGTHFSNPLNGASIDYHQHNTDWDILAVPGDFSSAAWSGHGVLSVTVPGRGTVLLEAGVIKVASSGEIDHQAGPTDLGDYFNGDASAVDDLCAALGEG